MNLTSSIFEASDLEKTIVNNDIFEKKWKKTLWKIPHLELKDEGLYVLVGKNGSGKSTLLRTLLSLIKPTKGHVTWFGKFASPGTQVGYVPEHPILPPQVLVKDWLEFFLGRNFLAKTKLSSNPLFQSESLQIDHLLKIPAYRLSKGQSQRIQLWTALFRDPKVLVLDEPFSGLDPWARVEFSHIVSLFLGQNKTVLISTHEISSELRKQTKATWLIDQGSLNFFDYCNLPE